jgi:dynein heavy chain
MQLIRQRINTLCCCCAQVLEAIEESMPTETPLAFGLHPNAEIGFKLREAETFCNSLVQLQPRESGG